jgi:hypothetical protein
VAKESEDEQETRLFADLVNDYLGFGTCVRLVECVKFCARQTCL